LSAPQRTFPCTLGGSVAAGKRRLTRLFAALTLAALGAALWAWWQGRIVAGLLCLATAGLVRLAWSLAAESQTLAIEVDPPGGWLRVRTRGESVALPLAGLAARRLTPAERQHLEELAGLAGGALSTGGFDSRLLGEFQLHATDLDHAVLLESEERRLVVTPDEPGALLAALGAG
jgi:hypothetical protein